MSENKLQVQEQINLQVLDSLTGLSNQIKKIDSNFMDFKHDVSNEIKSVKDDIVDLKENSYVDPDDAESLRRAIGARVYKLLGIPRMKKLQTRENIMDIHKYCPMFFSAAYREIPDKGHLGKNSYKKTKKKNLAAAFEDIENWIPGGGGVDSLKEYCDEKAALKTIVK